MKASFRFRIISFRSRDIQGCLSRLLVERWGMYFPMPVLSTVMNLTHSEFGEPVYLSSSDSLLWKSVMWTFRPFQFAFLYSGILRGFWGAWVGIVGSPLTLRHDLTGRVWRWPSLPVCCCGWGRGRECYCLSYFPWWFGQDLVRRGNRWSHCVLRGGGILVSVSCLPNQS